MLIDFDLAKGKLNRARHGLSLAFARKLVWEEALVWVDSRYEYDEIRMIGLVPEGIRSTTLRLSIETKSAE